MTHPDFTAEQRAWFDRACSLIDEDRLRRLIFDITAIHSPTGRERTVSAYLAGYLKAAGIESWLQPIGEASANAAARVRGAGGGPSLLLYAPIDTHLEADAASDVPWVGPRLRADMIPEPEIRGDLIVGLGAANPKGMAGTLAEAVLAVHQAGVPLKGDLFLAFGSGGMPVDLTEQGHRGLSDGVFHLLTRGVYTDFALVMKPGNAVYHEEPGLCWFRVSVKGSLSYAGIARGTPGFRSSIVPAARVIAEFEEWLPLYTQQNSSGQVAPQGWISSVHSGWTDRVAFPAATTEICLDLRCNPRTPPSEVKAQFADAIAAILSRHPDIDLDWDMIASIPGASTDPGNWIIRSAVKAWEHVEGRPHEMPRRTSGQTDISTIRNLGIPTARTGWATLPEKIPPEFADGLGGMGVAHVPDMARICRKLIYSVIDTATRTRSEVGCVRAP